ncbi:MAG TPA: FAD-dependent oxidoreductase [Candidatus Baltobacteraceae bacterium]
MTNVRCCIVGGGPAGIMLGYLLARAGLEVAVLEKHADFFRDFRGDTIHPSTLQLMYELGLLDEFLRLPHQEVSELGGQIGDDSFTVADFSHLSTRCTFIALMPQWDFLNFIVDQAKRYPGFHLYVNAEVTDLLFDGERVAGVRAKTPQGVEEFRADLVVGADGRSSKVRERAGLEILDLGAPMDVLWMRLSRRESDPGQALGRVDAGKILVMIDRRDYWQCGFVIAKGKLDEIKRRGLPALRDDVAKLAPFAADRVDELRDWDDIKLLTVKIDRLKRWHRPGLLCIGDAAHAMSPIGGVGINLAIQDAVASANILADPLLHQNLSSSDLARVQRRREFPTRVTQRMQVFIQDRIVSAVLNSQGKLSAPWPLRAMNAFPWLRRIPARLVGVGIRPEHVATPARAPGSRPR